jgi:hypothetical protein
MGALESQLYLLVPLDDLKRLQFTVALMDYYQADGKKAEKDAFETFITFVPTDRERDEVLRNPYICKVGERKKK